MKIHYSIPFLILLVIHFSIKVNAQYTITTIAGNGVAGYSGDGHHADSAELNMPSSVWFSVRSRYLYIADTRNNRIRKVDNNGIISNSVGNGAVRSTTYHSYYPTDSFAVNNPLCAAVNDSEEICFSETPYNLVWHVMPGTYPYISKLFDSTVVNYPVGICFNSSYDYHGFFVGTTTFIADKGSHVVRTRDRFTGSINIYAGNDSAGYSGDGGLAIHARLNAPFAIAVANVGNLYIADSGNHTIRKVDTFGVITTIAGTGVAGYSGDGGPADSAQLSSPQGVGVDDSGNVYISDAANNRIRMVDGKTGIIKTIAGNGIAGFSGDGGPADSAEINYPRGMFVDARNRILYFADAYNNRVRKIILPHSSASVNNIVSENDLNMFPNPSKGIFTLQTSTQTASRIEISNIIGTKVYETTINNTQTEIDLTGQAAGIYLVHFVSKENNIVKKIVISK